MHVEKVTLRNILRHANTTLDMPESSVVALTGANGHGKSSLVEAVSVALWGKTLRGTPAWSAPDASAYVRVRLGETVLHVTRSLAKGSASLVWHEDGGAPTKFETATKAQEALELLVGAHEVWRRASVFSSSDADSFSGASDGERKRMFESVLGVDRFDPALKQCRLDLQKAEHNAVVALKDHDLAIERLGHARTRKADAEKAAAASAGEDPAPLEAKAAELRALLKSTDGDIAGMRAKLREGDKAGAEHVALARQLAQTLERLRGEQCPTCEQRISPLHRAKLGQAQSVAQAKAAVAAKEAQTTAALIEQDFKELGEERDALVRRLTEAETRARTALALAKSREHAAAVVREMATIIAEFETKAAAAHAALEKAEAALGELRACEKVLGLKGPRAQIVARALGGLEAITNAWLERLAGPGLEVRISPFTETKTAGANDKIAFEVEGAGGGYGYRATSGGERRRLDVALLLALGEFVAGANGREVGTIFADEVFDALDDDGRPAVANVLHTLASEGRTVIVITHLDAFVRELSPDVQWRAERGVVTRV